MTNFTEIGSPIKEFIEKTRMEAQAGLSDWELKAPIELELSAVVSRVAGGGLAIQVLNVGAKVESEQIQKIKMSIGPKDAAQEAEKALRRIKAEAEEKALKKDPTLILANYANR